MSFFDFSPGGITWTDVVSDDVDFVTQAAPVSPVTSSDVDTLSSSDSSSSVSNTDNIQLLYDYFDTLAATVGGENETNRRFNAEQAELNRKFNAEQAELNRQFNSAESRAAREWSATEAQLNRMFNSSEAANTRAWQERLSNTAYQRAVSDMKKAGLNPILMASQGFSSNTPSGATGSGSSAQGFAASGQNASGQNASYNVGGGDTVSSLITSVSNAAKGLSDLISSIGSLFKPGLTINNIGKT